MEANNVHDGHEEKQLTDYCEQDLYDHYVCFQKEFAETYLRCHKDPDVRRTFVRAFHLYHRKKFWNWFDRLSAEDQAKMRAEWELGYRDSLRSEVARFEEEFGESES